VTVATPAKPLTLCVVWSPQGGGDDARLAGALRRPDLETLACDEEFSVVAALAAGGAAKRAAILLLVDPSKLAGLTEALDAAHTRVHPLVIWVFDPAGKPVLREVTPEQAKALAAPVGKVASTGPEARRPNPSGQDGGLALPSTSALQPTISGPPVSRPGFGTIISPPLTAQGPQAPKQEWIGSSSSTTHKFASLPTSPPTSPPTSSSPAPAIAPSPKLRLAGEGALPPKPEELGEALGEAPGEGGLAPQPLLTDEELAMLLGDVPPRTNGTGRERPGDH
jgi:hypothetical protein